MNMAPQTEINHAEARRRMKELSDASLHYVINDCRRAIEAYPEGHKAGYYQDEIHYAAMELAKRRKKRSR